MRAEPALEPLRALRRQRLRDAAMRCRWLSRVVRHLLERPAMFSGRVCSVGADLSVGVRRTAVRPGSRDRLRGEGLRVEQRGLSERAGVQCPGAVRHHEPVDDVPLGVRATTMRSRSRTLLRRAHLRFSRRRLSIGLDVHARAVRVHAAMHRSDLRSRRLRCTVRIVCGGAAMLDRRTVHLHAELHGAHLRAGRLWRDLRERLRSRLRM